MNTETESRMKEEMMLGLKRLQAIANKHSVINFDVVVYEDGGTTFSYRAYNSNLGWGSHKPSMEEAIDDCIAQAKQGIIDDIHKKQDELTSLQETLNKLQ